jgi:hypothetical protein
MEAARVSQDHSECTWLSGGSTLHRVMSDDRRVQPRWVRWTVIVVVVLVAVALALSVVPADAATRPPPPNATADYQLGGGYETTAEVVTRDRTDEPAGGYDICYVNAFQTQPGELGWWRAHHPRLLLRRSGRLLRDPGWPDEVLLDTRTAPRRARLARVLSAWTAGCARHGFDAVEPDNLDSWTRSRHLLSRAGNLDLARRLVAAAHRQGLAVAQKNTAELTARQVRRTGFDFAVAEDCQVYDECGVYRRLYGDHVIEVEYADEGHAGFDAACAARGDVWSVVYRDRDLRTPDRRGYVHDAC